MRFERPERVVYDQNPLTEVICQIRFPRLWQIESELPVTLQKRLGSEYPVAEIEQPMVEVQTRIASMPSSATPAQSPVPERIFHFFDAGKAWKASISSTFTALTASSYERWEGFRPRLAHMLALVNEIYEPKAYTRLGLRYQNVISRDSLGLESAPWRELLKPHVIALMCQAPVTEPDVLAMNNTFVLKLDNGKLNFRVSLVKHRKTEETACLIDSDFFIDEISDANAQSALGKLDDFNEQAGGLFRWCISDTLHRALRPRPVS